MVVFCCDFFTRYDSHVGTLFWIKQAFYFQDPMLCTKKNCGFEEILSERNRFSCDFLSKTSQGRGRGGTDPLLGGGTENMSITSEEVNLLVYRYLVESGAYWPASSFIYSFICVRPRRLRRLLLPLTRVSRLFTFGIYVRKRKSGGSKQSSNNRRSNRRSHLFPSARPTIQTVGNPHQ